MELNFQLQAAGLEGDWILRKIVGSPQKMEAFKKRYLSEDGKRKIH